MTITHNKDKSTWLIRNKKGKKIATLMVFYNSCEWNIRFHGRDKRKNKEYVKAVEKFLSLFYKEDKKFMAEVRTIFPKDCLKKECFEDELDVIFFTKNKALSEDFDRAGMTWYDEAEKGVGVEVLGEKTYYFNVNPFYHKVPGKTVVVNAA